MRFIETTMLGLLYMFYCWSRFAVIANNSIATIKVQGFTEIAGLLWNSHYRNHRAVVLIHETNVIQSLINK